MVEEYGAKKINESPDTQRKRLSLLKQFAVYLKKLGYKDIYIHNIKIKKTDSEFRPYIYTRSEISLIFDYIDKIIPEMIYSIKKMLIFVPVKV